MRCSVRVRLMGRGLPLGCLRWGVLKGLERADARRKEGGVRGSVSEVRGCLARARQVGSGNGERRQGVGSPGPQVAGSTSRYSTASPTWSHRSAWLSAAVVSWVARFRYSHVGSWLRIGVNGEGRPGRARAVALRCRRAASGRSRTRAPGRRARPPGAASRRRTRRRSPRPARSSRLR